MNPADFKEAIDAVATSKGVSHEAVIIALKEAIEKAYIKSLGGGDDAIVNVTIDEEKGDIAIARIRHVVKEVNDDYLEIGIDDANKGLKKAKYAAGDDYVEEVGIDEVNKQLVKGIKSVLNANLNEAERSALYEVYKDHIGEMVTGTVENVSDRSVSVNIGRTHVELSRKEMIGNETFRAGDIVKLYIQEVKQGKDGAKGPKGPQIMATRSSEGFLKALFEEEIREIYDGTVIIKGIAREAGVRSKVAVYSANPDIDPTGSCIGPGGARIQKIVGQLGGSGAHDKEKIDIIAYSETIGLYIADAMRPAKVVGIAIEDAEATPRPIATVVVEDEQLSVAIGKKGANARLAMKLTGWDLNITTVSEAEEDGITYVTYEALQAQAAEEKRLKEREAYAIKSQAQAAKKVEAMAAKAEEETLAPAPEAEEEAPIATEAEEIEAKEETVVEEAPAIKVEVKTTTTLEDLEKGLETTKKEEKKGYVKAKRPRKISEDEVARVKPSEAAANSATAMPIYSEEELAEMEAEDNDMAEDFGEDIDVEDYDDYYEE